MDKKDKIYVAGHRGMVGAAIVRRLSEQGFANIVTRTHGELDLLRQDQTDAFFDQERPDFVFLAAARVGGIKANNTSPAEFIYQNLQIQNNVIHQSHLHGVKKLLFLGSSCIYPKFAPQPMCEEHLMSGHLEPTNAPYAIAKIAGIEMCWSYNRQYSSKFIPVIPANLYGPNDNFNLESSHVLPAMIRKFHLARLAAAGDWQTIHKDSAVFGNIPRDISSSLAAICSASGHHPSGKVDMVSESGSAPAVVLWGTGTPKRELLHVDDLAEACIFLMRRPFDGLCDICAEPGKLLFNIGTGNDMAISDLAMITARTIGYRHDLIWDVEKPDGTPRKLLDISRLNSLGWSPRITPENGIRQTYQWYLKRLNAPG